VVSKASGFDGRLNIDSRCECVRELTK